MTETYRENPKYWWEEKGKKYIEERIAEEALDTETLPMYTVAAFPEVKKVLEVGCGFGRLMRPLMTYPNIKKIVGMDFSSTQIEQANEYLSQIDNKKLIDKIHLTCKDILASDLRELKDFDMVFTHGVLTHIHPENVRTALSNLVGLTTNWLVLIEFGLRTEGCELKAFEGIEYNELGLYHGGVDNDTWGYNYEKLLEEIIDIKIHTVSKIFCNGTWGHTTYICKKKSFYEVAGEIDEML